PEPALAGGSVRARVGGGGAGGASVGGSGAGATDGDTGGGSVAVSRAGAATARAASSTVAAFAGSAGAAGRTRARPIDIQRTRPTNTAEQTIATRTRGRLVRASIDNGE